MTSRLHPDLFLPSFRLLVVTLVLGLAGPLHSTAATGPGLHVSGDSRIRIESDFDSRGADGSPRDDRDRLRVRFRLGLEFEPSATLKFVLRLRSGAEDSHQSPHLTVVDFDDNDTGDAGFHLDTWYLQGTHDSERDRLAAWVGRRAPPFWKQIELFLDDDVTVAGAAGSWRRATVTGSFTVHAAYAALPVGMRSFSGYLAGLQGVYEREAADDSGRGMTLALGHYVFDADPNDPDAVRLLRDNGLRDDSIWVASGQFRATAWNRPLRLGLDLMHNDDPQFEGQSLPDLPDLPDQTDGLVASVFLGSLRQRGDWLAGYTYARVEALAVNASYAQDDWVRWGSATETRGSDFRGHELRYARALGPRSNWVARLYLVESITTVEDGQRFRLDLNVKF